MTRHIFCMLTILLVCAVLGCSGGGDNAIAPVEPTSRDVETTGSHMLWGLYQFKADPVAQTLEAVPLRMADMHLNALPFLEPPVQAYLTLDNLEFNGNIIEADIGLRHPFLGLDKYTGFDVAGILITNGSVTGFDDADIVMAGEGDVRLLNPDGWTRWWNPAEFPINDGTIFAYNDGLLGAPDSIGDYNCTLNAYKYYCDDLSTPDAPLSEIDPAGRGVFSVGQKNVRHYSIDMGSGDFIFNYAIDASWRFPSGSGPWVVPDDFPATANRSEAYRISAAGIDNTLFYDPVYPYSGGGSVTLLIDVYDWYDSHLNEVKVECSGVFDVAASNSPIATGDGWARYEFDIDAEPVSTAPLDLFITVTCQESGYAGFLPGEQVAAYFTHQIEVTEGALPVGRVFVASLAENRLAVINAATYEIEGFVYINGIIDNMLCSHSQYVYGGTLYNATSYIYRVHGNSLEVEYIELPGCTNAPLDVDINTEGTMAALAMDSSVIRFDLVTESIISTTPVDPSGDAMYAEFSLDDQYIYVSYRGPGYPISTGNQMLLIDANDGGIECSGSLPSGYLLWPMNLAVSPTTGNIYVTGGGDGSHTIEIFNAGSCVAQPSINTVGNWPTDVEISPDGTRLYCTNYYSSNISVVDLTTHTFMKTVNTNYKPWGITVANNGHDIFVGIEGGYQSGQEIQVIHTDDFVDYESQPIVTIGPLGTGIWDVVYVE